MLLKKFLHDTANMQIVHLFFDTKQLNIFTSIQTQHPHFRVHRIDAQTQSIPPFDILFIELGENNKEKLKTILGILSKHKPVVTYIFVNDINDTLLLKFSLHFDITDILPMRNDLSLLDSIFTKNSNKLDTRLETAQKLEIARKLDRSFCFLTFKNNSLIYANTKAKAFFAETDLNSIENLINENEELCSLLGSEEDTQLIIEVQTSDQQRNDHFICYLSNFSYKNEKTLSIFPFKKQMLLDSNSKALNRFDFVEQLKDKLVQQSVSQSLMSLIFINISNLEKLQNTYSNIMLHESLKHLLVKIFDFKEKHQELAQWSPNLYILLCENCDFSEACEQIKYLQQELINATFEQAITPILISSSLCTKSHDLSNLLHYIEKINLQSLTPQDIEKLKYYEIGYLENITDPKEQIHYLMRSCINNKIPIKLLNIYKGLCINTHSSVIKYSEDAYHLHCENLQGYTMQLEGETVLQAPNFHNDIKAEVTLVNIKNSFVILKNLNFLPYSANSRQHTRVQTNIRTPLLIKYDQKASIQGEIVDISVNSIAIRCSQKSLKSRLLNQYVRLTFSLPNEEGENGYISMDIEAKITFVSENDDFSKVVAMLVALKKPYNDYLLNYMYSRQKELILEIKRATKVYN